jgi:hypothetical protein
VKFWYFKGNIKILLHTACLKKNGPRNKFVIHDPNEKNYTGDEMVLKTLHT